MTLTAGEAEDLAARLFGVVGTATPLAGERDENALIDAPAGRYVLKLHAADADPDELAFQDAALALVGSPRLVGSRQVEGRTARLLTWIEGTPWAQAGPWPAALLRELGQHVALVDQALAPLVHPAMGRDHRWNMLTSPQLAPDLLARLAGLPHQVIHNDANEHNVLVGADRTIAGLIDFGDVVVAPRICGLAVACAYAMLGQDDPVRAIVPLVAGYHAAVPLAAAEIDLLWPLIETRLAMSVANARDQLADRPDNAYLAVSQAPIAMLEERLAGASAGLATARFRAACGYPAIASELAVVTYLRSTAARPAGVIRLDGGRAGGYLERRAWYGGEAFATTDPDERRDVHLGIDVWQPAGEPVHAPFAGVVEAVEHRPDRYDFGGVVILRHETPDETPFFSLHGHLSLASSEALAVGAPVTAGQVIGWLGAIEENGGWEPHLHFQLLTTTLGMGTAIHGVAAASELAVWQSVAPDPGLILGEAGQTD